MGGFDGGRMSPLGLLTCGGLHLCDSCLLMLFLLGFRGLLRLSSLGAGWVRSLRVSEDSSMYARFSPKKSSSWQAVEEAMLRGGEGRRIGWRDCGRKWGRAEEQASKLGAGVCLWLLFAPDVSAGVSFFFAFAEFISAALAPPFSMLLTVRQGWKLWSAE